MLNSTVTNKIEPVKSRPNLPLAIVKSRMKMEENKPSGSKIFANYAAQIKGGDSKINLKRYFYYPPHIDFK